MKKLIIVGMMLGVFAFVNAGWCAGHSVASETANKESTAQAKKEFLSTIQDIEKYSAAATKSKLLKISYYSSADGVTKDNLYRSKDYTYDTAGRLAQVDTTYYETLQYYEKYLYKGSSSVISKVEEYEPVFNPQTITEPFTVIGYYVPKYTKSGQLTSVVYYDANAFIRETAAFTYNAYGKNTELYKAGCGYLYESVKYYYDAAHHLQKAIYAEGSSDMYQHFFTANEAGKVGQEVYGYYYSPDDYYTYTTTFTYNANGDVLTEVHHEYDYYAPDEDNYYWIVEYQYQ